MSLTEAINSSVCAVLTEKAEFSELSCCSHSRSCSAYMYQDALHHKKTELAESPRLLSITLEHFFYLILCGFQQQGFFYPPKPKNPLKQTWHLVAWSVRGKVRG